MARFDIVTVGSNTTDLFVDSGIEEIQKGKESFIGYPVGLKLQVNDMHVRTGGGGTNTAVGFARLGLKTGYLGIISFDDFGKRVLAELKKEKVSFLGYRGTGQGGLSVILDSKERNRTILTHKGITNSLEFRGLEHVYKSTKWLYYTSTSGKSWETQIKLAEEGEARGIKLAFNPSWYLAKKGKKHLDPILSRTEVVVLNKEEAELIVGEKKPWEGLAALGPKYVCITNGPDEVKVYHDDTLYELHPPKVMPVEVTGCGDAYASGLVAGLVRGQPLEVCMNIGLVNAQSVMMHPGAKEELLSWDEAMKRYKAHPVAVKKV